VSSEPETGFCDWYATLQAAELHPPGFLLLAHLPTGMRTGSWLLSLNHLSGSVIPLAGNPTEERFCVCKKISGMAILAPESEPDSELFYDWRFTANQFVLAPSPLRFKARITFD
jgi:hypothetical protein